MVTSRNIKDGTITVCAVGFRVLISETQVQIFDREGKLFKSWRLPKPKPMVSKEQLTEKL